jgi:SulP family sulfate permease
MFHAPAAVGLAETWDFRDLRMFRWNIIPALSGDLLAVMFVTAITMLLNTTGIEFLTRREADLQRELKTLGVANLTAAALGGYVSCISLSRTTLNYAAGGRDGFAVRWWPSCPFSYSPPIPASSLSFRSSCSAVSCSISALA